MKSGASRHSVSGGQSEQGTSSGRDSAGVSGEAKSGVRPELVDATQYDLDRLERAIRGLVAQQHVLGRENAALVERLAERDDRIARLESDLESAVDRRKMAFERVQSLIDELDRLDAALDRSMADVAGRVYEPRAARDGSEGSVD